jgi:hypothetical protein
MNLIDSCAIEVSIDHMKKNNINKLKISLKDGENEINLNNEKILLINNKKEEFLLKKSFGWSFSYLFDRKFEFFSTFEEFIFPTSDRYKIIIIFIINIYI